MKNALFKTILGVVLPLFLFSITSYLMFKSFDVKRSVDDKELSFSSSIPFVKTDITEQIEYDNFIEIYNQYGDTLESKEVLYENFHNFLEDANYLALSKNKISEKDEDKISNFLVIYSATCVWMWLLFSIHLLRTFNIMWFANTIDTKSYYQSKSFLFLTWFSISHILDIIVVTALSNIFVFLNYSNAPGLLLELLIIITALLFFLWKIVTVRNIEKFEHHKTESLFGIRDVIEDFIDSTFERKSRIESLKTEYTKNIF